MNGSLLINSRLHARLNNQISHLTNTIFCFYIQAFVPAQCLPSLICRLWELSLKCAMFVLIDFGRLKLRYDSNRTSNLKVLYALISQSKRDSKNVLLSYCVHSAFCCAFTACIICYLVSYAILCSGSHEVLLGVHDFDDFDNGGQPEVYDIDQIIEVCFQIELF